MGAAAPARSPRTAPRRDRRAQGGHLIPLAVNRTAGAVRHLPDSGPIKHLTRGRAWIPLLGLLLIGIVALNVATLSLTATAGKVEENIQTLGQENSVLSAHEARLLANGRVRSAAASIGLTSPEPGEISYRDASRDAIAAAARRLSAISG